MSDTYSDLILISQEGSRFAAHRAILAGRSDYFSALLYGGLKESEEKEVSVLCSDQVLKTVLAFLYSGEVFIESPKLTFLMTLLSETRMMFLTNLEAAVEDLILNEVKISNIQDGIELFNLGLEKDFDNVTKASRKYLEDNVDEILNSMDYMKNFSVSSLKTFMSGNDLDVPEMEIFRAVDQWSKLADVSSEDKKTVLSQVRLDQMTNKQLVREIRPSGLFSDSEILEAIRLEEGRVNSRKVILNQNICLETLGAKVIKAECAECDCYVDACDCYSDSDLNSVISGKCNGLYVTSSLGERLEIQLPSKQKINKIKILFDDRKLKKVVGNNHPLVPLQLVHKDYSYKIESSLDGINWEIVADFSNYWGRSWQTIYFEERRMKFLGIVGIEDYRENERMETYMASEGPLSIDFSPEGYLHVIAVEAILDTDTEIDDRKNTGMK